jgi:hypothetical protein
MPKIMPILKCMLLLFFLLNLYKTEFYLNKGSINQVKKIKKWQKRQPIPTA